MSVYTHQWGEGENTVLAFHGWSGDHRAFESLVPFLPEGTRLISFDHPGFGRSPAPDTWSFDRTTQPILDAIEKLGDGPVTLLGNCSGAFTALQVALRLGPRAHRIVLIDPFAYTPWYFRLLTFGWLGRFFYRATFANPIGRMLTNLALAAKRKQDTDLTDGFDALNHDHAYEYLRLLCSQENIEPYRPVRSPVDIIYGANTFSAVRKSIPMWMKVLSGRRADVVEGTGHLPITEAPAEVAKRVFVSEEAA